MKHALLILLSSLSLAGFEQKQFEGTIVYNLHSSRDKTDAQLIILFGKNAVKLEMKENGQSPNDGMLIRLDSGKIYTFVADTKTYQQKTLFNKEKQVAPTPISEIAGFKVNAIDIGDGHPIAALLGRFSVSNNITLYVADSLFYNIPDKFTLNPELSFVRNNKIILGLHLRIKTRIDIDDEDDTVKTGDAWTEIKVDAMSIKWGIPADSEFSIPSGFVKYGHKSWGADSLAVVDSAVMIQPLTDSITTEAEKKNEPVKKQAAKKPTTAKPKTNNSSAPIRKPE